MKLISTIVAFMCGVVFTGLAGLYFFKMEVSSQVAYTNALAIHQIIDGLEKDEIVNAPKTQEWLCHISYRMTYDLKSVWAKTATEFIFPSQEKLVSHREKVGLSADCEH